MTDVKFPEVEVQLTGEDGNVFSIVGRVTRAMRRAGVEPKAIDAYSNAIFACGSYDEALRLTMQTVTVS